MENSAGSDWFSISSSPLSVTHLTTWVAQHNSGAIITFCGTARGMSILSDETNRSHFREIGDLDETHIKKTIGELRQRWPEIEAVAFHLRVGMVELGDHVVVLAVSSPNRRDALEACEFCVDAAGIYISNARPRFWRGGSACSDESDDDLEIKENWKASNRLTN
jgi:molybdopterin synthase catalytic subunit